MAAFVAVDDLRCGRAKLIDDLDPADPDRVMHSDARIVIDGTDDRYEVMLVNTGAAGRPDSTNYLDFELRVGHDPQNDRFTVDELSGRVGAIVGKPVDVGAVPGTAAYCSAAADNYALHASRGGLVESGPWVANATLSANFDSGGVSGRIENFVAGIDLNPRNWSVELPAAEFSNPAGGFVGGPGGVNPLRSMGAERDIGRGAWLARLDEADPDGGAPPLATGRFTAAFQKRAAMSGAFNAHRN